MSPVFEKTTECLSLEKMTRLVGEVNFKESVCKVGMSSKTVQQVQCFDKTLNQPWKQCKQIKLSAVGVLGLVRSMTV